MKLVLAEKPSVAQSIAKVLGAAKREDGYLEGNGYVVSWCVGHLVELAQPEVYDAKYSKWAYADLPIFPMDWQYEVSAGTKKQFGILKKLMAREDVASLVCATDAGREGELIFRLVYHKAGCRKPFERLWISSMEDKEKQNTDLILSEGEAVRTKVRDNIELDLLCRNQPESAPVMQEIYELVVETIQLRSPVLRLGSNLFPMALVRERLLQLTSEHIRFVLDGLRNLHTDVKNLKKYLLTMLFNAPVTLNGRTMLDVRKSVNSAFRPMLA